MKEFEKWDDRYGRHIDIRYRPKAAWQESAKQERKRIVELIKTSPDYNESYFCFHTLDKLVELIEEV